jgi:Protein of unknown function (DUF2946)
MHQTTLLQTLRRASWLARWAMLGFMLSLGVAIASPMVNPQSTQLICSASGGMKVIVTSADGSTEVASQSMDCPLCVSIIAPPPVLKSGFETVQPLSYALQPIPAAILAQRTAAPPPARGPPHFL